MKRNIILILFFFSLLKADELVKIDLGKINLGLLFERDIQIVKVMKNYAIAIIKDGDGERLKGISYESLDKIDDGKYYLITVREKDFDLSRYAKVLFKDDDIFLIKIYNDKALKEIMKHKISLQYLTLKPVSKNTKKFNTKFKYEQAIQNIVNSVNPDTILSFVRRLQNFKSRYSTYDSCFAAAMWIKEKFIEYGCDTVIFQYHTTRHAPNVIGIKYGTHYLPNHYSIICGHFDSHCFTDTLNAPGADDNASGTSAVIECARVLKNYKFEYTIRFIAFSGEEFGLYGSEAYADFARIMNDTIIAVVNADMIGYTNEFPDTLEVYADNYGTPSEALADFFIECAENYTSLLCIKKIFSIPFSDHASFWDKGFTAIGIIEELGQNMNPFYHTTGDTIGGGYNDNFFATEVVKTEIATIASISSLSYLSEAPIPPLLIQPFDCSKIFSPYPEFSFLSSDPQRDDIQYLILIDETPTFTSPESILTSIFPSDTIVKYQLITPLSHGNVYFWKVKAKDPYGTNYWSLFSDVRSFTVDTTLPYNTCSFLQCNFNQFSKNNLINLKVVGDSVLLETYGYIYDTLLYEDFEGFFPQNWGINDGNNDGIYWSNGISEYIGVYAPPNYNSKYAYYNDYPAGYTINSSEELISPAVYIPSGSTNIRIVYDYGIKIFESGEKMILKTRKFNSGSWGPWINRYTHYQSSFGNFSYLIPSNYFPLESLQVKWTYTDVSTINHRGYACAIDNVLVVKTIPFQNNYGEMITKDIKFCELSGLFERDLWGDLIWEKSDEEDSIGIMVQYYNGSYWENVPDNILPGNSIGIFTSKKADTISLNLLDTLTYNRIRVKVLFKRFSVYAKSGTEPSLLRLEVGNLSRYVGIDEIKEDIFEISGNIVYSDLEIRFFLKKDEVISISLFDITGRNVKNILNNERLIKGFHKIKLGYERIRDIPKGVYFLYFETGSIKRIKRLILIR